jgi:hypothetical protein
MQQPTQNLCGLSHLLLHLLLLRWLCWAVLLHMRMCSSL